MAVFFRHINTGQANLVLHLVGIQHGDGVAISNTDNPARDLSSGMGGAGQRQQTSFPCRLCRWAEKPWGFRSPYQGKHDS